ncbi:MAG: DUF202 domain-containing protein [Chryseolinea sp.]
MEERKRPNPTDHLANERTFLAWIRTSVAIMAFGFVVVKFALFVKQISFVLGEGHQGITLPNRGYSAILGIALVGLGTLMALLAFFRYKNIEKQLNSDTFYPSSTLSLLFTIAIIMAGLMLVFYLLPSI